MDLYFYSENSVIHEDLRKIQLVNTFLSLISAVPIRLQEIRVLVSKYYTYEVLQNQ